MAEDEPVKIGNVYEDTDPRAAGRRFVVLGIDQEEGKATVQTLRSDGVWDSKTRIRLDRLRSTTGYRGYKLVDWTYRRPRR